MAHNDLEHEEEDHIVPVPIQAFLWGQTCPFIRPKLGKLHEATCVVSLKLVHTKRKQQPLNLTEKITKCMSFTSN